LTSPPLSGLTDTVSQFTAPQAQRVGTGATAERLKIISTIKGQKKETFLFSILAFSFSWESKIKTYEKR